MADVDGRVERLIASCTGNGALSVEVHEAAFGGVAHGPPPALPPPPPLPLPPPAGVAVAAAAVTSRCGSRGGAAASATGACATASAAANTTAAGATAAGAAAAGAVAGAAAAGAAAVAAASRRPRPSASASGVYYAAAAPRASAAQHVVEHGGGNSSASDGGDDAIGAGADAGVIVGASSVEARGAQPARSPSASLSRLATIGNGVSVRQSAIPASGLGLYATRDFEAGDFVTEYDGQKNLSKADCIARSVHTHICHKEHVYVDGCVSSSLPVATRGFHPWPHLLP